ncbi:hypothetical protein U9M48_012793 [Paspalum notatum var. saurae]|uniref:Uncharacterized protein n=1 Tax=Paspalum notatum var. saurae TaxID=547442 RepID=A0AAQ3SYB6_PASNO
MRPHRPPPVDSRVIDIGFDNTSFLIFFDCAASVACGVTETLACAAPLFVCTSTYVGSSSPPPIGRLHLRHRLRHRRLHLARRQPDQPIAGEPPSRDVSSIARCFAKQEGCHCVASSGSNVAAYRRPRRCIYMLSTLSVHVSHAWSSSAVQVLRQLQAPPSRYSGAVKDLLPERRGRLAAATPGTSMRRHDFLYAFVQHNLVASVAVSSSPSSSTPTTAGCIGTFFLAVLLRTATVVEAFSASPFK